MTTRIDRLNGRIVAFFRTLLRRSSIILPVMVLSIFTLAETAPSYAAVTTSYSASGQQVASASRPDLVTSASLHAADLAGIMPARPIGPDGEDGGSSDFSKGKCQSADDSPGKYGDQFLAVSRWGDGTSNMHARQSANAWDDITQKVSRYGIDSTFLSLGNTFFSTGTNWVEQASLFCPGSTLGSKFNVIGGTIAKQIWDSGILALLFIVGVLSFFFAAFRSGRGDWRWLTRSVVILGAFSVMMTAASAQNPNSSEKPAMSPGWIIDGVNNSISGISSGITGNLQSQDLSKDAIKSLADQHLDSGSITDGNKASCVNFLGAMHNRYKEVAGGSAVASVPMEMDSMWQMTGLPAYINTQFGKNNNYGWQGFCWPLERASHVDPVGTLLITGASSGGDGMGLPDPKSYTDDKDGSTWWKDSPLWGNSGDNSEADMAGVFGAQCQYDGGWKISPGFNNINNKDANNDAPGTKVKMGNLKGMGKDAAKQCEDEWNNPGDYTKDHDGHFKGQNWSDYAWNIQDGTKNLADMTKDVTNEQIQNGWNPLDFLAAWHGNSGASDSMSAFLYMFVAFILMLVFGGLALMVFLMKLVLTFMGIMLFFVLLSELIPGREGSHLGKFVKQVLGFSFMAFGFSLILGIVMSATSVIVGAGPTLGLTGLGLTLWVGFAPMMSLFAFSWLWKNFVKAPNPLSPKGMMAYARSSGSMGAAAAGGAAMLAGRGRGLAGDAASFALGRRSASVGAGAGGNVGGPSGTNIDGVPGAGRTSGMGSGLGSDAVTAGTSPDVESAGLGEAGVAGAAATGGAMAKVADRYGAQSGLHDMRKRGRAEFDKAFLGDRPSSQVRAMDEDTKGLKGAFARNYWNPKLANSKAGAFWNNGTKQAIAPMDESAKGLKGAFARNYWNPKLANSRLAGAANNAIGKINPSASADHIRARAIQAREQFKANPVRSTANLAKSGLRYGGVAAVAGTAALVAAPAAVPAMLAAAGAAGAVKAARTVSGSGRRQAAAGRAQRNRMYMDFFNAAAQNGTARSGAAGPNMGDGATTPTPSTSGAGDGGSSVSPSGEAVNLTKGSNTAQFASANGPDANPSGSGEQSSQAAVVPVGAGIAGATGSNPSEAYQANLGGDGDDRVDGAVNVGGGDAANEALAAQSAASSSAGPVQASPAAQAGDGGASVNPTPSEARQADLGGESRTSEGVNVGGGDAANEAIAAQSAASSSAGPAQAAPATQAGDSGATEAHQADLGGESRTSGGVDVGGGQAAIAAQAASTTQPAQAAPQAQPAAQPAAPQQAPRPTGSSPAGDDAARRAKAQADENARRAANQDARGEAARRAGESQPNARQVASDNASNFATGSGPNIGRSDGSGHTSSGEAREPRLRED